MAVASLGGAGWFTTLSTTKEEGPVPSALGG
jgi:hypothetical protein